mmetsp:Transcript_38193/g.82343  ORF Transcript_38193/g.82343 Transcript_38193/m.82343 type:complete len:207 (-) Transcript_38193:1859-2479(-)
MHVVLRKGLPVQRQLHFHLHASQGFGCLSFRRSLFSTAFSIQRRRCLWHIQRRHRENDITGGVVVMCWHRLECFARILGELQTNLENVRLYEANGLDSHLGVLREHAQGGVKLRHVDVEDLERQRTLHIVVPVQRYHHRVVVVVHALCIHRRRYATHATSSGIQTCDDWHFQRTCQRQLRHRGRIRIDDLGGVPAHGRTSLQLRVF